MHAFFIIIFIILTDNFNLKAEQENLQVCDCNAVYKVQTRKKGPEMEIFPTSLLHISSGAVPVLVDTFVLDIQISFKYPLLGDTVVWVSVSLQTFEILFICHLYYNLPNKRGLLFPPQSWAPSMDLPVIFILILPSNTKIFVMRALMIHNIG